MAKTTEYKKFQLKLHGFPLFGYVNQSPLAEKCACGPTVGAWLVEADGMLFRVSPSTQLQKDIWIENKPARMKALRWLCLGCATVQMP